MTRKAVKGWKAVFPVLKYRNERMHEMRQNYVVGLAKKTIKGWKSSLLYKDTKDKLYQHLYISISLIKKRQIMKAMRLFSEWRSKQSQRDKLLVSQVHKIRKDYIVKMWYQRALLFSSCRYFAETMSRYQKRCFIKKLNENMERQHLTLAYLDIHREQILQKTVFNE